MHGQVVGLGQQARTGHVVGVVPERVKRRLEIGQLVVQVLLDGVGCPDTGALILERPPAHACHHHLRDAGRVQRKRQPVAAEGCDVFRLLDAQDAQSLLAHDHHRRVLDAARVGLGGEMVVQDLLRGGHGDGHHAGLVVEAEGVHEQGVLRDSPAVGVGGAAVLGLVPARGDLADGQIDAGSAAAGHQAAVQPLRERPKVVIMETAGRVAGLRCRERGVFVDDGGFYAVVLAHGHSCQHPRILVDVNHGGAVFLPVGFVLAPDQPALLFRHVGRLEAVRHRRAGVGQHLHHPNQPRLLGWAEVRTDGAVEHPARKGDRTRALAVLDQRQGHGGQ